MAHTIENPPAKQETWFYPWVGKIPWRREGNPLQYSCLENSIDKGAWWAIIHGVAELDITDHLHSLRLLDA